MKSKTQRRSFNLNRREEWVGLYNPWFDELISREAWARVFDPDRHASNESRLAALATEFAPDQGEPYLRLKAHAAEFLRKHFTHVVMYHACRISDEASYLQRGLCPSDIDDLNRLAEKIFGASEALSRAIRTMRTSSYTAHNRQRIGLFFTRQAAASEGDHYLRQGSEYLQVLSNELSPSERAKLGTFGRPALVRCDLELDQLDESDVGYAATLPIRDRLTVRQPDAPEHLYVLGGGTMHSHAIPPCQISIEYVDLLE